MTDRSTDKFTASDDRSEFGIAIVLVIVVPTVLTLLGLL